MASDGTSSSTRRAVLRNGLAIAGSAMVAGTALSASSSNGKLVFTYDDGPVEDYTNTYRKAHRKEGVPGCSAVVASYVGGGSALSASQLRTLEDEGWEIMSHTVQHRLLAAVEVTRDVASGDRKLHVSTNVHGKVPGDELVVSDGTRSTTVTVTGNGSDEKGEFVELESPVGQAFTASDGVTERYSDAVLRTSLRESKRQIEEYGVDVSNIVMPYGGYGRRTQELVDEHYTAVANGGLAIGGRGQIHHADGIQLPHLSRTMFRRGKITKDELGTFLDRVASEDTLGILGGHSWATEKLSPSRIRMVIQMAKDRNVDIVTLRDALADLGVTDGSGTTTTTSTSTTTTSTTTPPTSTTTTTPATTTTGTGTTTATSSSVDAGPTTGTGSAGEGNEASTSSTTTKTNQPGFGVLAGIASIGGALGLKRYSDE
ncbi:polysaccharide deacetylase family protein [Halomicrococcus gelatinilyticus]|uniref:polysaccharide deacetylase family protein n=1 Tax=Halomicrococcus gelatinilyticus TaxID=1702103 RepID=UPI002E10BCA8